MNAKRCLSCGSPIVRRLTMKTRLYCDKSCRWRKRDLSHAEIERRFARALAHIQQQRRVAA